MVIRVENPDGLVVFGDGVLIIASAKGGFCKELSSAPSVHSTTQGSWIASGDLNYWVAETLYAVAYDLPSSEFPRDWDAEAMCRSVVNLSPTADGFLQEAWNDNNTCQWSQGRNQWRWTLEGQFQDLTGDCESGTCKLKYEVSYSVREGAYIVDEYCKLDANDIMRESSMALGISCGS
jgi:hypothetical protein